MSEKRLMIRKFWGSDRPKADSQECSFFMARQPIFDRDMRLVGYELLYRRSGVDKVCAITRDVELAALANVLVEVGLDRLAPMTRAYVNVPVSLLGSDALKLLPKSRVILEILEDTPWNKDVERNLIALRKLGYSLALDDYTFGSEHDPFLEHVDVIKVDVLGMLPDLLTSKMSQLPRRGKSILAEKVERTSTFDFCKSIGFDYFQGYFISQPKLIRGTGVPANHAMSLALLAKLNDPDATLDDIERLLSANVVLCHKVLRLVNSVEMALRVKVESVRQALQHLGLDKVRTLASLAVTTAIRGKPPELYSLAIIRANYCEALARSVGYATPEKHFMVGLLSVLGSLIDVPVEVLVSELPLSKEVKEALCGQSPKSPCSITLRHALAVEQEDWKAADSALRNVPTNLYLDAVGRARRDERLLAA